MLTSFYNQAELRDMGFGFLGKDVQISRKASFYNPGKIHISNFSRIDDFCVFSAGGSGTIKIGRNVHIAVYVSIIGKENIIIEDFANISSRVSIYSSNDDYSGEYMTNPTVDRNFTNVNNLPIYIGRHVLIGSGSIVLPGVHINEGACVGALSLVNKNCDPYKMYAGIPAIFLKDRSRNLLDFEAAFLANESK